MFDFYDWKKLFGIGANEVKKGLQNDNEAIFYALEHFDLDGALEMAANRVRERLSSQDDLIPFLFEEMDAASYSDYIWAKKWTEFMPFDASVYRNAMGRYSGRIDGPDGPQMAMVNIAFAFGGRYGTEKMVAFRILTVLRIIQKPFENGLYNQYRNRTKLYNEELTVVFNALVSVLAR